MISSCNHSRAGTQTSGWCPSCGQPFDRRRFCPACHEELPSDVSSCPAPVCKAPRPAQGWVALPRSVQGGYELLMQAGRGYRAAVYLARDSDRALVAVRLVARSPELKRAFAGRFSRECSYQQQFLGQYQELVRALHHGLDDGSPFLVLECVQGPTLNRVLGPYSEGADPLNPARRTPLSAQRAVRLLRQISTALARLHQHKLIHRGIKPSNIFVGANEQGELKLADFGWGWLSTSGAAGLAAAGMALTPQEVSPRLTPYLAPEVVRGEQPRPCADIYALGVLAHEMLTGTLPYQLTDAIAKGSAGLAPGSADLSVERWGLLAAGWLKAHLVAERVPPAASAQLPGALTDLLDQCLTRDPRDRIQSTAELTMQLALVEQELARGPLSTPAAPRPTGPQLPVPPQSPALPLPLPAPSVSPAPAPQSGGLGEVIKVAQERDRLALEVAQLRAALQQTQQDLDRVTQERAAARAEVKQLRQAATAAPATAPPAAQGLRLTSMLPGRVSAGAATKVDPEAASEERPTIPRGGAQASQVAARVSAELAQAARSPTGPHPPPQGQGDDDDLLQTRLDPRAAAAGPASDTGPQPAAPAEDPLLQTTVFEGRIEEEVPSAASVVDRVIAQSLRESSVMASKQGPSGKPLLQRADAGGGLPDRRPGDMDNMPTVNLGQLMADEQSRAEPTAVVSEDEILRQRPPRTADGRGQRAPEASPANRRLSKQMLRSPRDKRKK